MEYTERSYSDEHEWQAHHASRSARRFPPGVKWIILVTVGVYVLELLAYAAVRHDSGRFLAIFGWLGLSPSQVFGRGFVWQLVTYAFLHDPDRIFHILFNMLFLYWFGREIELRWGTKRFVLFYLTAAMFAAFVFSIVHIFMALTWCIGASGAVMAILMVYALWWPNRRILLMFFFPMRIRSFVILLIVIEAAGFLQMKNGVANMAHMGGLLYGYLVIRFGPQLAQLTSDMRKQAKPATLEDERQLDEVLDKVHRDGIQTLSWREKRFLKKMSKRP